MTETLTTNPLTALAETTRIDGVLALDYALRDGGRAPGALTGSRPADYAPVAVVLEVLLSRATGVAPSLAGLDQALSLVVNGSDDVAYALVSCAYEADASYADVLDFIGYGAVRECDACEARYWSGMGDGQDDHCRNCHDYGTHAVAAS